MEKAQISNVFTSVKKPSQFHAMTFTVNNQRRSQSLPDDNISEENFQEGSIVDY